MTLLQAALDLAAHGCSVIPVNNDGSKRPLIAWKQFQTEAADAATINGWFSTNAIEGVGVITGAVSGNLELLEVEGRAIDLVPPLGALLTDSGMGELWARICSGWLVQSPSGGLHFLYRIEGAVAGNTKLARRPNPDNDQLVDVLIETRGEGGYLVTAPSGGSVHPTGKSWVVIAGGPATCPVLTVDERDALHLAASTFDAMPARDVYPEPSAHKATFDSGADGLRPGDDYNNRASWDDLLTPLGWQRIKKMGNGYGWVRPGKDTRDGISATTGTAHDGVDRLYVFSSSTEFETERPYSKFAAYALLEHHGDMAAAASALRKQGYGTERPEAKLTLVGGPERPTPGAPYAAAGQQAQAATDGAAVLQLRPAPESTVSDSEDAHAQRLIVAYGDLIRYCPQREKWLTWSGTRWVWQPKGGGLVREYAKRVARGLTESEAQLAQRRKALSSAGISGCLKQAETDERILVDMGALDADGWTLNSPAGPIDLRTGELLAPDPAALCTKSTTVAPNREDDAAAELWATFLADTFGDDIELRDYVQRLVGVTLIGEVREQLLAFLHGLGANGKSTLAEALMHALGVGEAGYAIAAPSEMLMIRKHSEHPAELAQLAGARMVVCSELDDGQKFAEARIKQLTGRDSVNARFLYGNPFTFTPTHTLWLLGNHRPQAATGGLAFWRRVKLLEFAHVVPVEHRDPALGDKLNAAAGTILAWAIDGCVDYLARGIREPRAVSEAVAAYAADQDTVGRFVEDMCHRADSTLVRVKTRDLRNAYESWCGDVGEAAVSPKRFGQELRERFNVTEAKSNGQRFYARIMLTETEAEEPAPAAPPAADEPQATLGFVR